MRHSYGKHICIIFQRLLLEVCTFFANQSSFTCIMHAIILVYYLSVNYGHRRFTHVWTIACYSSCKAGEGPASKASLDFLCIFLRLQKFHLHTQKLQVDAMQLLQQAILHFTVFGEQFHENIPDPHGCSPSWRGSEALRIPFVEGAPGSGVVSPMSVKRNRGRKRRAIFIAPYNGDPFYQRYNSIIQTFI